MFVFVLLLCVCVCVSEGKSLKDEDVLQHLPVGTTATFYFRDLGAQISWVTVSAARSTAESATASTLSRLDESTYCASDCDGGIKRGLY